MGPWLKLKDGKKKPVDVAQSLFDVAIAHLENPEHKRIKKVLFLTYSQADLDLCKPILEASVKAVEVTD